MARFARLLKVVVFCVTFECTGSSIKGLVGPTKKHNLQLHIKVKHQNRRYPCEKCEYMSTQKQHLKIHIEIKHENKRYPCDSEKCEF